MAASFKQYINNTKKVMQQIKKSLTDNSSQIGAVNPSIKEIYFHFHFHSSSVIDHTNNHNGHHSHLTVSSPLTQPRHCNADW